MGRGITNCFLHWILLNVAFNLVFASGVPYEKGEVADVSPQYIESPAPMGDARFPHPEILVGYKLRIRVGDLVYFVEVLTCCPLKTRSTPEWVKGNAIEYRFEKDKMLVRRQNGKDSKAKLLRVELAEPNQQASASRAGTVQPRSFIEPSSKHDRTLPLGVDFLRAGDSCLMLDGDVMAGSFFTDLSRSEVSGEFSRHGQIVAKYPDKLTVRVFAALGTCSELERSPRGSTSRDTSFNGDFMGSVIFECAWKRGFDERVADLGPVIQGRIANPTPFASNRDWWEYEFDVRSDGVSIGDSLVVIVQSPDGKLVARLSSRLPGRK
jgi:hypothetical protein